ncbi:MULTISPECIES: putative quinol monooxygenase [unclassified Pedobacter]|uniref:putative quinol monooxygenase n=1 Tax=unclassified Pedobacter TaxID=2628915 RepID=UPI00141E4FEC|nr:MULTISPECIES: putative quinol monooxygenase [unclassified Pedobacter]NII84598.1 quinol monooxygenase YgiN [Pedobacter sp. SG908]NMN38488.1 quinol monooxygenase YgiN [Pedobacter sp. SG918]
MSIYLTAIVKSKKETTAALRTMLLDMVANSRKEEACIQYDLHESAVDNTFVFQEEWKDQAGLDLHNKQPYILDFVAQADKLTDNIIIYKTEKLA